MMNDIMNGLFLCYLCEMASSERLDVVVLLCISKYGLHLINTVDCAGQSIPWMYVNVMGCLEECNERRQIMVLL